MRKLQILLSVIVGTLFLFGGATAVNANAPSMSSNIEPAHVIVCDSTPYVPALTPGGIQFGGRVTCSDSPDIRATTMKLWRCSGGNCFLEGSIYHNSPTPPSFQMTALGPCRVGTWSYHSQVIIEFFHGNWATSSRDSADKNWTC
ncbi:hypothetical protein ABGB07_10275 [Micromonosporaceae bacterium B7E4]